MVCQVFRRTFNGKTRLGALHAGRHDIFAAAGRVTSIVTKDTSFCYLIFGIL